MITSYVKEVSTLSTSHKVYRCLDCEVHFFAAKTHRDKDRLQVYDLSGELIAEWQKRYKLWRTSLGDFSDVSEVCEALAKVELSEL